MYVVLRKGATLTVDEIWRMPAPDGDSHGAGT